MEVHYSLETTPPQLLVRQFGQSVPIKSAPPLRKEDRPWTLSLDEIVVIVVDINPISLAVTRLDKGGSKEKEKGTRRNDQDRQYDLWLIKNKKEERTIFPPSDFDDPTS